MNRLTDNFDYDAQGRAILPPAETEVDYDHRTGRWVWGAIGLAFVLFWGWVL